MSGSAYLMDPSAPQVYTKPLRVAMPMMSPFSSRTSRISLGTALVRSHCRRVLHPALREQGMLQYRGGERGHTQTPAPKGPTGTSSCMLTEPSLHGQHKLAP